MSTETHQKTFTVTDSPTVNVGNIHGQITVTPGDPGEVSVIVTRHLRSGSNRTHVILEQNDEDHVIIQTKYHETWSGFFGILNRPDRVDFAVTVPENCTLLVKTVSGSAEVKGLAGLVEIGSVSGSMLAENLRGPLKLDTVSGDIEGRALSGPLTLKSVSGKARLHQSNVPSLQAKTVSGNLILETPLGEGPYTVGSVSGRLVLVVLEGSGCTADISSVSGSVHTDLPHAQVWKDHSPGHRRQRIAIGQGGPEISLKSVSGSLRIVTQADFNETATARPTTARPATTPPPQKSPSKMDLLERIARGELTVDDAVTALQN